MKLLFFDFNGTLLDDMPIWESAMHRTFRAFGAEPPTTAQYFSRLEEFRGDYLGVYESFGVSATRDQLNAIYEPAYEARLGEVSFFPGTLQTLSALEKVGAKSVLITTQNDFLVVPFLKKHDMEKHFHSCQFSIYDKAGAMKVVMAELGLQPSDCCYVGDAPSDMRHAEKAGVLPVAFLGGYIPEELLMKDGVRSIRSLHEVLNIV